MEFVVATNFVNRYGFRLDLAGAKIDSFRNNPILLYGHDRSELPIGRWENLRVDGDKMMATPVFDTEDAFAMEVMGKVERGILNAASVSFDPLVFSQNPEDLVAGQTRSTIKEWELLEISIVDIPGDRNAVRLSNGSDIENVVPALSARTENSLETNSDKKMDKIIQALGLSAGATEDQAVAAIVALQGARVESLLAVGTQKGIVTADNRGQYERLAKADYEAVQLLFNNTPAVAAAESQTEKTEEVSLTALIRRLAGGSKADADDRESWSYDQWSKNDSQGLLKMKRTEPEKYAALAAAKGKAANV